MNIPLYEMKIGEKAPVIEITAKGADHRRLLDLGIIPNTEIEVLYRSPSGDPTAYKIRGTVLALRKEDAKYIWIQIGGTTKYE